MQMQRRGIGVGVGDGRGDREARLAPTQQVHELQLLLLQQHWGITFSSTAFFTTNVSNSCQTIASMSKIRTKTHMLLRVHDNSSSHHTLHQNRIIGSLFTLSTHRQQNTVDSIANLLPHLLKRQPTNARATLTKDQINNINNNDTGDALNNQAGSRSQQQ